MWLLSILLALYWFSVLPIRSPAWTFVWRDAQNNTHVPSGSSDFPCAEIANLPDMVFEYDADGDLRLSMCIKIPTALEISLAGRSTIT